VADLLVDAGHRGFQGARAGAAGPLLLLYRLPNVGPQAVEKAFWFGRLSVLLFKGDLDLLEEPLPVLSFEYSQALDLA
jgi:hypothetical protein